MLNLGGSAVISLLVLTSRIPLLHTPHPPIPPPPWLNENPFTFDELSCKCRYAAESINIACKWGYKGVEAGETLSGKSII